MTRKKAENQEKKKKEFNILRYLFALFLDDSLLLKHNDLGIFFVKRKVSSEKSNGSAGKCKGKRKKFSKNQMRRTLDIERKKKKRDRELVTKQKRLHKEIKMFQRKTKREEKIRLWKESQKNPSEVTITKEEAIFALQEMMGIGEKTKEQGETVPIVVVTSERQKTMVALQKMM